MNLSADYQIIEKIYTTPQKKIFRAIRHSDGASVIVKTLAENPPSLRATSRLKNEYEIIKYLNLVGIAYSCELYRHRNRVALILEDIKGQSLNLFLQEQKLSLVDFFNLAYQLSKILVELHHHQIIHRDLKPANIIINPETFQVSIIDFGIAINLAAKTVDRADEIDPEQSANFLLGTLTYISPEQTGRTNCPIDYRSDLYSLGITFYEMLTNQLPFNTTEPLELIHAHLAIIPQPPQRLNPEIPEIVSAIVMKLLAKNAEDRYQTAYGLQVDLKTCLEQLLDTGKIEPFDLGTVDRYSHFSISPRLYGCSSQLANLMSSWKRVRLGTAELAVISGGAGTGKTALVEAIAQSIVKQGGYFATGKFDLFQNDIPNQALVQALRSLMQQILTEAPERIKAWKQKILAGVGENGRIITEIVPEAELIIGTQPAVAELDAAEFQNRFERVSSEFIRVFSRIEHPLVLFLDNLQWADSACLKSIEQLMAQKNNQCLLIIGAYRDDELNPLQSLIQTIARIESHCAVNQIVLGYLQFNHVRELVADTLHCTPEYSEPLAKLLFQKTEGNPLFINQLLKTLHSEKLLTFNRQNYLWQWDVDKIATSELVNRDLAQLMVKKVQKLPEATQQILKWAACIGNQFNLELLAALSDRSLLDTAVALWAALEAEIILDLGNGDEVPWICDRENKIDLDPKWSNISYRFFHEQVQQILYQRISKAEKLEAQLKIGRLLLQRSSEARIEENIFNIADRLNFVFINSQLIGDRQERHRLAELNLIAGKKAKKAGAYDCTVNYLNTGLKLLPKSAWQEDYSLTLDLHLEAVEAQYLQTNFQAAEQLTTIVLERAQTLLEKVRVYEIKIHACIAQNQMELAIATGIKVLNLLGVSLPTDESKISLMAENLQIELQSKTQQVDSLKNLPKMVDPLAIATIRILITILPPIYIARPQLFTLVIFKTVNRSLQSGNSALSAYAYAIYGFILCTRGRIDLGYEFGKLALTLVEQLQAREIESKVDFVFNNMIRHWQEAGIYCLDGFKEGIKSGIESGDVEHACFNAKYYCTYLFLLGQPLPSASEKSAEYISLMTELKQEFQLNYARIWLQLNLNLQGKSKDKLSLSGEEFRELEMLSTWQASNNATGLFAIYLAKLILCYLFKDYQQAIAYANLAAKYSSSGIGTMCFAVYYFYHSLTLLALYSQQPYSEQQVYLDRVKTWQDTMKQWATFAPSNYRHKYDLVEAETARVLGQYEKAAEYYDRSIQSAAISNYIQESALASELAAEFYLAKGRQRIAQVYIMDAYHDYLSWGAVAKATELTKQYPLLILQTTEKNTNSTNSYSTHQSTIQENLSVLDLASAIKASQTISSEIVFDKLLSKLMKIIMENVGAAKGLLLLERADSLVIAIERTVTSENEEDLVLSDIKVAPEQDLPLSLINYVYSTKQMVILEQAAVEGLFVSDPYIIKHKTQSVISLPIVHQDKLLGIIYLENNYISKAFTPKQVEILKVLLSQVAISLENARLYQELKEHASVKKSLQEKELLLKEIHHRVKNNLFVVANLLEFQASYIEDPEILKMFENSQSRINSMALIHEHLYGTTDLNTINFCEYVEALIEKIAYSCSSSDRSIEISTDVAPIHFNVETANPCGLIINELVSNALEHAFPPERDGNIWLSLKPEQDRPEQIVLSVKDDGVGYKGDRNLENNNSLGLQLVCTLVEQLEGNIELITGDRGTEFRITFSQLKYTSRI